MWSIFAPEALTSTSEPATKPAGGATRMSPDSSSGSVESAVKPGEPASGESAPTGHVKKANGVGSRGTSVASGTSGNAQGAAASKQKPRRNQPQSREEDADAGRDEEEDDWVEAQSKRLGKSQKTAKRQGQKQKDAVDEAQRILSAIWALTLAHPSAVPTAELTALFPPSSPLLVVGDKESKELASKKNNTRASAQEARDARASAQEARDARAPQPGCSPEVSSSPSAAHEVSHGGSANACNSRRGNGTQRKLGGSGRGGGSSGSVRIAYVQKGQDANAPESAAETAPPRDVGSRSDEFDRSKGASRGNTKPNKVPVAGRDAGVGKVSSQHGKQQNNKRGPGSKQGQYDTVIRNDKRGEARLRQQPPPQHVSANGEDEDMIGDMVRRKLREAMTVEELQAAVHEARKAGLVFEAQLGEKKLMKMTGGGFHGCGF
ncbi:hypothetical protein TGDOM2_307810 [Toxoplasma gondii GAB2-2007-GAL-DOM2]|uniref:Uncharacterized protein n=10 Tax=Toxoplasma gondii TaxID=5811 RepID=B9Q3H1_TOXGV|nr:hypothetical protein TGGT1_307810 [Toxoplasma gondii GT1]ESS28345.1 hypothetical protein TGVEG_307810 [Toxoplasma gondii VEG]KAF4638145.1 hypothetical protein TGRH88_057530 [Toxoplasma gondii]KFG28715.1 hypothetical protein TGP89_307810 [Toxoplasma gondii p89]KFG32960.1 hypothetical protein TGFOU_307810 [Toxoplasma gondii FOU]KFG47860.1 hypothetical protein TGDOM2_307810 [Toxoplasma gondii GAB2-2007-GAL-DOM2]KFH02018.1 hypothetical protein TGMAS_307810 [Toxoplasma gondii MAS]KFH04982.1 hy